MPDFTAVSIITGGGRGIGQAVTMRLARETAVILVGRTQSDLEETCEAVRAGGGRAEACVGHVTDPVTAEDAVQLAQKYGWTIRNLICNAGIGRGGNTHAFKLSDWLEVFDTNVHGGFYFVRACLPAMLHEREGVI